MASEQARIRVARPGYRPDVLSIIGLLFVAAVGLWLLINFIKAPADFYNLFLIGLTNGCVYGLVALGYSLVYGILELINFAHGDVFMLGGMLVATMTTDWALANKSGMVLWLFILLMLPRTAPCSRSPAFPTRGTASSCSCSRFRCSLRSCGSSSGRGTERRCGRPRRTGRPPR